MNEASRYIVKEPVVIAYGQTGRARLKQALQEQRLDRVKIKQADSFERVVALLEQSPPDCLLLDLHPAEEQGLALLQELSERFGGIPCPVVVVSDTSSEQNAVRFLQAGAHDCVSESRLSAPFLRQAIGYAQTRHKLRQDLEQLNLELTHKNRIKTQFVTTATHELRTPLTAIVGLIDLLQEEKLTPRATGLVSTISACCDALLLSVDDVLDLTKIEAGEFVLYPTRFHPGDNLSIVATSLHPIAQDKGIELTVEMPRDLPEVTGDARRTRQMLYNLASNAVKFTRRGKVVLRVASVEAAADATIRLRYEVEDTGVGIAEEDLARIFQRNYQVSGRNLRSQGTGLGLAIVEGIARRMGGQVGLESVLGQGSTFWLELPFTLADQPEPEEPRAPCNTQRGESPLEILVAEDNPIIARVMARQLKNLGHNPTLAYDGVEALSLSRSQDFDVALLDVRMPRMDGISVAFELRKRYSSAELPIILLTAEAQIEPRLWKEAGIDQCLVKPASPEQLRSILSERSSSNPE